jgi:putative transposase
MGGVVRRPPKPEPEPKLLSRWPLPRLPGRFDRVNASLSKQELDAVRLSAQRWRPSGDERCVESIARRLNLESTLRLRGRPRVRFPKANTNKEACPLCYSHAVLLFCQ